MAPITFAEFGHNLCFVFVVSCAAMLGLNLFIDGVLEYEISNGSRVNLLLLIFAVLVALFVPFPGQDLAVVSAAGPADTEHVANVERVTTQFPLAFSPPYDFTGKDREIEALKAQKAKIEALVVEERKRVAIAESKTKAAEKKRDDFSYELQSTKERCAAEYLTHVDRLRELQIANNELVDAEERNRELAEDSERASRLCRQWEKESRKHKDDAKNYQQQAASYRWELLQMQKKYRKLESEKRSNEARNERLYTSCRAEVKQLTARVKSAKDMVIEMAPIMTIDTTPSAPETRSLIQAHTILDISPISLATTSIAKHTEPETGSTGNAGAANSLVQAVTNLDISPITLTTITNAKPTEPMTGSTGNAGPPNSLVQAVTTLNISPATPTPTETPKPIEPKMGSTGSADTTPTPANPTEPTAGSTGSGRNPPPAIPGRKIARPVSRINRPKKKTPREEVNLLTELIEKAEANRGSAPTKEALYDIIVQMSKMANIYQSPDPEDIELALEALTRVALSYAQGRGTFPEFLADMASGLCNELEEFIENRDGKGEGEDEEGDGSEGTGDDDDDDEKDAEGESEED